MDLVYTCYRGQAGLQGGPEARETAGLSAVSSSNTLLVTSMAPLVDGSSWGAHVMCSDLNTPWAAEAVCALQGEATCLAWDSGGERFVVGDSGGQVQVWERREEGGGAWRRLATASYPLETFLAAGFFLNSRPICVNEERQESQLYNEKFSASAPWRRPAVPGCVLVSATGLLLCLAFPAEAEPVVAAQALGLARRRVEVADTATDAQGKLLVAAASSQGPVVVTTVTAALRPQDAGLTLTLATQASFSIGEEGARVCSLRFLLPDCTSALVVGVGGQEGGKVHMWQLESRQRQVHKLFTPGERGAGRQVAEWTYTDEFAGGGGGVAGVASPRCSVLGGERPACYVAVAFADGSVQLLLRDSLQQIASVELPRGGTLAWGKAGAPRAVTVTSLTFTATGNCLVVVDSLGQLYLYSMSPIADPGGPSSVPYTVQALEHCLVATRDCWDLAIAFKPHAKLEAVCDRFAESFAAQSAGVRSYYRSRFLAIKATLYRMAATSVYRAADTTALLMLESVGGAFKSLLRAADSSSGDSTDPATKLDMLLTGPEESQGEVEAVVGELVRCGLAREVGLQEASTLHALQHLATWSTTLALHLLASVPEYRARRGPGYLLATGGEALPVLREILAMVRLWNLPRAPVIAMEKELDLVAKLFGLVTRLMMKMDDESLIDECLMLPHKVLIPGLDTVQAPRGVAACLTSPSPHTFTLGQEPDLASTSPAPFIEGLSYTDDINSSQLYDSVQKMYLGKSPPVVRRCTRCTGVTAAHGQTRTSFTTMWEGRWAAHCLCGGPWTTARVA